MKRFYQEWLETPLVILAVLVTRPAVAWVLVIALLAALVACSTLGAY